MRSVGTQFCVVVGTFALLFSGMILYRAWSCSWRHAEELISLQAELALEFDLAIREYAAEAIRPEMAKRVAKDEFVVEAMSTSFISRRVFEKVRRKFPDYVIKFSSRNPRNPVNQAGPKEMELIEFFRNNPEEARWVGKLDMHEKEYLAHFSVRRIEQDCLQCHGLPEDSPKSLLEHYGNTGGFHYKVGDIAGMDVIAIPMDSVNATLISDAKANMLATAIWLVVLFGAILIAFRFIVTRRLLAITKHFQAATSQTGPAPVSPAPVSPAPVSPVPVSPVPVHGKDEISTLAQSFNALAARLQALHESLEDRVRQRTAELKKEQQTLRHLLHSSDHERQLIAYEIHDGLAQQLTAAIMQLQSYDHFRKQDPEQAEKAYEAGTKMLRQGLEEARQLISGVRPPILDESGIVAAVSHLIHDCRARKGAPEIAFRNEVTFDRLAPVLENTIYRIVQESLTNALTHSKSEKVRVELAQRGENLRIEVQDWGIGFTSQDVQEGCFGLEGIQERTRLHGGTLAIDSIPGEGTRIAVDLPVVLRETIE